MYYTKNTQQSTGVNVYEYEKYVASNRLCLMTLRLHDMFVVTLGRRVRRLVNSGLERYRRDSEGGGGVGGGTGMGGEGVGLS